MGAHSDFKDIYAACREAGSNVDAFRQAAGCLLVLCQNPQMQQDNAEHVIRACKYIAHHHDEGLEDLILSVKKAYLDTIRPLSFTERASLLSEPAQYVTSGPLYDLQTQVFDPHWNPSAP